MHLDDAERRILRIVVTAALRAAVAWSRRDVEPRAWRELSRMTGVVSHALGPGNGLAGPLDLADLLHKPIAELLSQIDDLGDVGDLVFLDAEDQLTDAAVEVGCEYTEALFDGIDDPGQRWLPSWSWQSLEQVQRSVFEGLIGPGSEQDYATARRFLIEHPAGDERDLTAGMNKAGARRVASYTTIPADRLWRSAGGTWWWPCPTCRWPMRLRGSDLECGFSHHDARFRVDASGASTAKAPDLVNISGAKRRPPAALPAEGARCVELAVWRFVVVPGVPELELEQHLLAIDGVTVQMWPGLDRVDLAVEGPGGRRWEVDVKDHSDPQTIVAAPPVARDIVVPDHRRALIRPLARALPHKRVWTMAGFVRSVQEHAKEEAR